MINVTQPFLPPKAEFEKYISGIWERNWLTNNGPLVNELEQKLKDYLGFDELLFLANGTVAIQIAIKALGLKGKIITTPFSYVATTSSIVWEGCEPVFVDIDAETLNIDPLLIEKGIDKDTTGILATHCFGNACDINAINEIAKKYNLKVIYDAAHCFGTKYSSRSVFEFGDVSTTSFHATKLFHTIEGGAIFSKDPKVFKNIFHMRNFGHDGPEKFSGVGINGKNSEFHAAMGLCNIKYIEEILMTRKDQCDYYDELLKGVRITKQKIQSGCDFNYAYYPVVFENEETALRVKSKLESNQIFPRRYFYPSLSELNYVKKYSTPKSADIAKRILCLPIYHDLQKKDQERVAQIVKIACQ